MSSNAEHIGSTVRAALRFIVPQADKPVFDSSAPTGGEPVVHFRTEDREGQGWGGEAEQGTGSFENRTKQII